MPSRAAERINFGKIKEVIAPPNLIEIQVNSYREFLQVDVPPSRRKNLGLQTSTVQQTCEIIVITEMFKLVSELRELTVRTRYRLSSQVVGASMVLERPASYEADVDR